MPALGISGISGSLKAFFLASIQQRTQRPLMVITTSGENSNKWMNELLQLYPSEQIFSFPDKDPISFEVVARSLELTIQRLKVLERLPQGEFSVVVVPVRALLWRLMPLMEWQRYHRTLKEGMTLDLTAFLELLVSLGYERAEIVEAPGQFSVRGGIIDFYPLTERQPVRLELFDDEIESLRRFVPDSQRSFEALTQITVSPAREIVSSHTDGEALGKRLQQIGESVLKRLRQEGKKAAAQELEKRLESWRERLIFPGSAEGLEPLRGFLYPQAATLLDYLPANVLLILDDLSSIEAEIEEAWQELTELWHSHLEEGKLLFGPEDHLVSGNVLREQLASRQTVAFSLLPQSGFSWQLSQSMSLAGRTLPRFLRPVESIITEFNEWKKKGYLVVILVTEAEQGVHLQQTFLDYGLIAVWEPEELIRGGPIVLLRGQLSNGFELTNARLVVVTEKELFGQARRPRQRRPFSSTRGTQLEAFTELKVGDYVVHVNHGIGQYQGVEMIAIAGIQKDYLVVQYAGEDRLYVPTDQVSLLQKYIGADALAPKLNKLGGNEWQRTRARVKQSVKDIAQELIELYAAREAVPGFSFSPDNAWQKEFEAAFPYEETPDQWQSIEVIKQDMLRPRPMDRLLCGDVGYGKTEVALRAAFKAVMDSKQVAVLVPTTILAQQHYHTFQERLADYPVTVEVLSRFRTPREQKDILARTALGQIDILIGTHRLLSNDVTFRDLGLLIVDEEQRFGVTHKERLKRLRQNVDVLTLTATPIPRTLHMALAGVRDMSLIETPPEDRYPVQTYVVEYSPELVREAINRELRRGGQVYYVHNRIFDLRSVALLLQELIPEARLAIAHGQMKEDQLERIMLDFVEGEYDVLVSTSIVESGLDIPNVNTLIVEDADHLGLAQLYQLRGRVGRSNRLAYAYFTYRKDKVITEVASKRLQAIRDFTEFGSGFKIALRDLEIRGAGNILGAEQHGHMTAVGFDMYCRLLEESIQELQGESPPPPPAIPVMELPLDTYIPDEYLSDPRLKVEIYKKLAGAYTVERLEELAAEIRDRFGVLPEALENLINLTRLRLLAVKAEISNLQQLGDQLYVRFSQPIIWPTDTLARLTRRLGRHARSLSLLNNGDFRLRTQGIAPADLVAILETLLWEAANLGMNKESRGETEN